MSVRLSLMREHLRDIGVEGVIIPRGDAFSGEEVRDSDERLRWISGFTGSAGMAVVTKDQAVLFSDDRYRLQMDAETDQHWHCLVAPPVKPSEWLAINLADSRIGFDPMLITAMRHKALTEATADAGIALIALDRNPVDAIWNDRPPIQPSRLWDVDQCYAGRPRGEKISAVVDAMKKHQAEAMLITDPTELAWLLNIRGGDLLHTPVFLAFAMISSDGTVVIFHNNNDISSIEHHHIQIIAPDRIKGHFDRFSEKTVLVDPVSCPFAFVELLHSSGCRVIKKNSPISIMKAQKNQTEQDGFRMAHQRDALAMIRFLHWLDKNAPSETITESAAAETLLDFRRQGALFISESFAAISASGANSAVVHYRAQDGADSVIKRGTLYLIDSGGQYHDATTDITRTVAIGEPTHEQCEIFTHVLKAHIALDRQRFPPGTSGARLDAIARAPLWQAGFDFGHGTGHGVGCCLSVHESPPNISPSAKSEINEGMVLSNEPGYYRDEAFGIRLENLLLVRRFDENWLGFECLTLVPFDRRLVLLELLNSSECAWLDAYHDQIRKVVAPQVGALGDAGLEDWLERATAPIKG